MRFTNLPCNLYYWWIHFKTQSWFIKFHIGVKYRKCNCKNKHVIVVKSEKFPRNRRLTFLWFGATQRIVNILLYPNCPDFKNYCVFYPIWWIIPRIPLTYVNGIRFTFVYENPFYQTNFATYTLFLRIINLVYV